MDIVVRASARCLRCGEEVVGSDGGMLTWCSCGAVGVDGPSSGRIVGEPADYVNTSVMSSSPIERSIQLAELAGAADDHRPTAIDLIGAPTISDWDYSYYPGTQMICLIGNAVGHPRLPDGPTTTRPLVAIDTREGWARTQGRYYRLGNHALGRLA